MSVVPTVHHSLPTWYKNAAVVNERNVSTTVWTWIVMNKCVELQAEVVFNKVLWNHRRWPFSVDPLYLKKNKQPKQIYIANSNKKKLF